MRKRFSTLLNCGSVSIVAICSASSALAQESGSTPPAQDEGWTQESGSSPPAPDQGWTGDIIVTAQKRSERLNDVPISVTVASGQTLRDLGITDTAGLTKLVPSFQATQTYSSVPTYSLRGIGFYSGTFGARQAVGLYQDEVELPFGVMAKGANLDLERIEVLKGPQGILFGQNVTGGLVNYIAAKPTKDLSYGGAAEYGRFSRGNLEGYVSGPIGDTLAVRVAGRHEFGDGWQKSYTRDDTQGRRSLTSGRVLVDWSPSSNFKAELNLNGWNSQSDTQAGQLLVVSSRIPGALSPEITNYPLSPRTPRAADWDADDEFKEDLKFYQTSLRLDLELGNIGTLTSISAYSNLDGNVRTDSDGIAFTDVTSDADLAQEAASEEVRLAGEIGERVSYLVGGSYAWYRADQNEAALFGESSVNNLFQAFGVPGIFEGSNTFANSRYRTISAFANIDTKLPYDLTLRTGIRYSKTRGESVGCTFTPGAVGALGFSALLNFVRGNAAPLINIQPGGCYSVDANNVPGFTAPRLREESVPFRVGLDWKPSVDTLVYVNLSRGFKGGSFPLINSSKLEQYEPATQERLTSYEGGLKTSLLNRKLQVNASVFHYLYKDKQITGAIVDPIFGPLQKLVNVPESHVDGAELEVSARPFDGLTLRAAGAYTKTEIDGCDSTNTGPATGTGCFSGVYYNFDSLGNLIALTGSRFPQAPSWTGSVSADYRWDLNDRVQGFVGGDVYAQSSTLAQIGADRSSADPRQQALILNNYTTVDLRAGIAGIDHNWNFTVFGRNVFNEYYRVAAQVASDTLAAWTGMPATYGIAISFNY